MVSIKDSLARDTADTPVGKLATTQFHRLTFSKTQAEILGELHRAFV